jgi:hypothetical protein|tara:strand:- start:301 stop:492 length:192 start_codon:yes stop_codon:yes gene_type:complete
MHNVYFLAKSEKNSEASGVCECGNDTFHTIFGPEDTVMEARHLIALRCSECGEEQRSSDKYDS